MATETLLCFGGPNDGQLLAIDRSHDVILVPRHNSNAEWHRFERIDEVSVTDDADRYNVEKVYLHDERRCMRLPDYHDEQCFMTARCLVASGYPRHRITDTLTALALLTSHVRFLPWGPA